MTSIKPHSRQMALITGSGPGAKFSRVVTGETLVNEELESHGCVEKPLVKKLGVESEGD